MKFHHICLVVSDLKRSIDMWTGLFDFQLDAQFTAPDDAIAAAPDSTFPQLMEDIWGMKGTRTQVAFLSSPGGALLELQEAINPPIRKTPTEYLNYYHTGIREIAFQVEGIDDWFARVKKAGFKTQTDYVWNVNETARSFLFYDDDHHLIQLWENPGKSGWGA
jgi:catechol 2,3-dioxygenase-like lactoylglutathione lyase family enzyme